jgi:hypothetical protein
MEHQSPALPVPSCTSLFIAEPDANAHMANPFASLMKYRGSVVQSTRLHPPFFSHVHPQPDQEGL